MAQRVTAIVAGYLAACLAAGLVFSVVLAAKYSDSIGKGAGLLIAGTVLIAIYAVIFALLPAFLGIIYAERTGVTSILYYAVGGALTGIVAYGFLFALLLTSSAGTTKGFVSGNPAQFLLSWIVLFGPPGLAGGLVYWLVAGRKLVRGVKASTHRPNADQGALPGQCDKDRTTKIGRQCKGLLLPLGAGDLRRYRRA